MNLFNRLILILLLGVSFASHANAWVQTQSSKGKLLHWRGNNINFWINPEIPPGLAEGDVLYALRASFSTWSIPSCTCIRFKDNGTTTSRELGYDVNNPDANINIILFQQTSWGHDSRAVAITSNVFNESTGEVVAFDMELNSVNFTFSIDGKPRNNVGTMDIRNVVTHEVGHVIGLDHSPIRQSTMYVSGQPGELNKRDLHSDDVEGLCALYPTNGCTEEGNTTTTPPTDKGCGCSQKADGAGDFSSLLWLSLFALLLFGIRRLQH